MWCQECQQDVPAVFSRHEGGYRCPRCSSDFCGSQTKAVTTKEQPAEADRSDAVLPDTPLASPPVFDDWELGEQLKHVERVLAAEQASRAPQPGGCLRFDRPHTSENNAPHYVDRKGVRRDEEGSKPAGLRSLVWPLLALGLMTFVCGGVLIGWSLATGRSELWTIGMPIALVGQIGLLTGLILQLEKIWEDHRAATAKLDHFDDELHDLRTTTTLLGTSHFPSGSSFYSHFAGGASPQILLTDLKSQLDLLAVQISRDEK